MTPALVAAWAAVAERLVALWQRIRRGRAKTPPSDPTGTAPVTPAESDTVVIAGKTYRRRPPAPAPSPALGTPPPAPDPGHGSTLAVIAGAVAVLSLCALLAGCAGPLDELDGADLIAYCRAIVPPPEPCLPCEPCPPPEIAPGAPKPTEPGPTPAPTPVVPPAAGPEAPVGPSDDADKPAGALLAPPVQCDPDAGRWLVDADGGRCGKWVGRLSGPGWEKRAWPGTLGGSYHYLTRMAAEKENGTETAAFVGLCRGKCTVWAGYFAGENRARVCTYKIGTKDGKSYTATLDQKERRSSYGPRWVRLGTWSNVRSVTLVNGPDHSESVDGIAVVQER